MRQADSWQDVESCHNEHTSSLALELELVKVRVLPAIQGSNLEATSILRVSGILLAVYLDLQDSIKGENSSQSLLICKVRQCASGRFEELR